MSDQGCKVEIVAVAGGWGRSVTNPCGAPCVAHGMCARHYQQDRRGRLGKTKEIASPGQAGVSVKSVVDRETFKKLKARAKAQHTSISETIKALIIKGLG